MAGVGVPSSSGSVTDEVDTGLDDSEALDASLAEDGPDEVAVTLTDDGEGDSTQSRDERGRFKTRSEQSEASDALNAASPPATDSNTTQPGAQAEVAPEPFTFRGDRKVHTLEGAEYRPGEGVRIPDAVVPQFKQMLADAVTYRGSWRAREAAWTEQLNTVQQQSDAQVKGLDAVARRLLDVLENEELFNSFAVDRERELRNLKRELALELREAGVRPKGQTEAPAQAEDGEQIVHAAQSVVEDEIETLFDRGFGTGLTEEERSALIEEAKELLPASWFPTVDGRTVCDTHAVRAWVQRRRDNTIKQRKVQSSVSQAEAQNKRLEEGRKVQSQIPGATKPQAGQTGAPGQQTATGEKEDFEARREKWRKSYNLL